MALRATPTIAICLTAGIAFGIALNRPGNDPAPEAAAPAPAAEPAAATGDAEPTGDPDSPYLADAEAPVGGDTGQAADTPAPVAEPVAISIEGFAFSASSSVAPGAQVAVTNLDSAPHTLTADDGSFDTGNLDQNGQASFAAPSAPGTYAFFCAIHPSMTGELVVS
ncbi:MAG: cupredoxin domain-containing protein [Ilumatobacter sp.]